MKCAMHGWMPVLALSLAAACASHTDLSRESTQAGYGVEMAQKNLWREAMFRFQRAVEINPDDAMAHNNLAVAYEANGDFAAANKEYLTALRLDRTNEYIKKNYGRFSEFMAANKKRDRAAHAGDIMPAAGPSVSGGQTMAQPPGSTKPVGTDPGALPHPQPPPPVNPPPPNPPQGGAA